MRYNSAQRYRPFARLIAGSKREGGLLRFIGIGAQKAGTTWLYSMLRQHPCIGFPAGKEMHFWDQPHNEQAISDYLFRFGSPGLAEGEITPAYSSLDGPVVQRIQACAPHLRLIFIVRNPLERAWSSALMVLQRLRMSFDEASDAWFIDHFRSANSLRRGDYAATINRWRGAFGEDALLVIRYEQLREAPEMVINRCLRHIGVEELDDERLLAMGSREVVFAGARQAVSPVLWAALRDLYGPRIAELELLLDADLSRWLVMPTADG